MEERLVELMLKEDDIKNIVMLLDDYIKKLNKQIEEFNKTIDTLIELKKVVGG